MGVDSNRTKGTETVGISQYFWKDGESALSNMDKSIVFPRKALQLCVRYEPPGIRAESATVLICGTCARAVLNSAIRGKGSFRVSAHYKSHSIADFEVYVKRNWIVRLADLHFATSNVPARNNTL